MAQVSIEFAGLVVAVISAARDEVSVMLPDARSVGGPEHSATMLVKDHKGLKGVPDFTVTRSSPDPKAKSVEYAGWFLRGEVQFTGPLAAFTPPTLDKTMDLKFVADAADLVAPHLRSLSATVKLTNGSLASSGFTQFFDFKHDPGTGKVRLYNKLIELSERLSCDMGNVTPSFKVSFTGRDGQPRVVTIAEELDEPILISNLMSGAGRAAPHFDAYYELVTAKRTPEIVHYEPDGTESADPPDNPDECRASQFQL